MQRSMKISSHYYDNDIMLNLAVGEHSDASSRVIFLTDLCSTVDSVNDERKLLETIKSNADRGIYTTVVGIGMVSLHHSVQIEHKMLILA